MDPIEHRRLNSDFAALRFQLALLRFNLIERKYRPDQPRIPAGSADGGRWTDGDSSDGDGAPELDAGVFFLGSDERNSSAPPPPEVFHRSICARRSCRVATPIGTGTSVFRTPH